MEEMLKQILGEILATREDVCRLEGKIDKIAENQQQDVVSLLETVHTKIDQQIDDTNKILRRHELDIQILKKIAAQ